MADPFTWAAIGTGASTGGSLLGAFGASQSASAQAGMYRYQAGVADQNKKIALQNADYTRATGEQQSSEYGIKAREQIGQIVAGKGASGLDVNSGSSSDVIAGQRTAAAIDLGTIRSNAAHRAYGYDVEAANLEGQKGVYEASAEGAEAAGKVNVLSSLIGGVSSVSSKWLQGSSAGLFGKGGGTGGDPSANYG